MSTYFRLLFCSDSCPVRIIENRVPWLVSWQSVSLYWVQIHIFLSNTTRPDQIHCFSRFQIQMYCPFLYKYVIYSHFDNFIQIHDPYCHYSSNISFIMGGILQVLIDCFKTNLQCIIRLPFNCTRGYLFLCTRGHMASFHQPRMFTHSRMFPVNICL